MENLKNVILPAFCDAHAHFREPGFEYKETIESGCRAAAAGGYSDVLTMPNLDPVPDCPGNLRLQLTRAEEAYARTGVRVRPFGSITVGEKGEALSDMDGLAPYVAGFSDDGKGVQDGDLMRSAMEKAKSLGKVISAHCEDNSLLFDGGVRGCVHKGAFAAENGFPRICSESEWRPIERDLRLARETGCAYHVCHISCRESVELIRKAKRDGADVTCETAPHYLILDDSCLKDEGRFKMNPPLRSKEDREALIEGLCDGTIDMIATDHAPHSDEEKSKGLRGSAFGITGLETAFPLMYTNFVRTGVITLGRLVELMSDNPRKRFGIPPSDVYCVWDLEASYVIDPGKFLSKGKATPFAGFTVYGVPVK